MKIMIAYPPLENEKGTPLLGQNRQFQWFNDPTYIYPVIPASAATLLSKNGHEVIWADAIAEEWSYAHFLNFVKQEKPDLIAMETKTPVVKQHWHIIHELKRLLTPPRPPKPSRRRDSPLLTVLFGDHVTALPEESMRNSPVDFVLTGGDYDFLLLNLCNHLANFQNSSLLTPHSSPDLEPGIYYRDKGEIKNTGTFELNHNLNSLPFIDRELTKWQLYAHKNGNYKKTPGTYIMSGRDCWWRGEGGCTFCSWPTLYPRFRARTPENVLDEIGVLIEKYKVKEIMDDTGTFPAGKWLRTFCQGMIARGYSKKVSLDCNMRFGVLNQEDWNLMAKAGFRLVLFGLESANQTTLNRINKNVKVQDIVEGLKMAKKSGLAPHITAMVGYPWETKEDAERTVELSRRLFKEGWVDTLQATIVIPYPGSRLYREAREKGWLRFNSEWERYDMTEPVLTSSIPPEKILGFTNNLYQSFLTPQFIIRKIVSIRNLDDIKFLYRASKALLGHWRDFSRAPKQSQNLNSS